MKKIDFNRNWTVQKDGEDKIVEVNLPHDAMIKGERNKNSKTTGAGGYFETGKYIYRKKWNVGVEEYGKTIILECEGVYQNSHVSLNGEELYFRPYGYTNYFVNLSKKLKFGEENTLEIIADNSQAPNSRWYSGAGIYREVQLYVGPAKSIAPDGVKVTIISTDTVRVDVDGLELGEKIKDSLEADIKIYDGDILVAEGNNGSDIKIPDAKTWDAENPNLYRVVVSTKEDEVEETFGLRQVSWGKDGLKVNGKEVLLRGSCIHHDNGVLGAATFAMAEERRVRILKEAGFNAIRCSHNPMSKAMLSACDRLGMYVMDETFDMWFINKSTYDYGNKAFRQWWKEDVKAMVDKDFNHPSVIMYSIGNEISDLGNDEGQAMCKEMATFVKNLDNSKATTMGINLMLAAMVAKGKGMYGADENGEAKDPGAGSMDSMPTSDFFNMLMNKFGGLMEKAAKGKDANKIVEKVSFNLDIPGYNYAQPRYAYEVQTYPDRPFVGSETLPKQQFINWQDVKKYPNLVGDFIWTGWDYLGEAGIGTVKYVDKKTKKPVEPGLVISGGAGEIDICGKIRPECGWNKTIWGLSSTPVISVEPISHSNYQNGISMWRNTDTVESWSWEGCEGYKNDARVYTDAAVAELFVNGKSLGKKKVKQNMAIFKNVEYQPGEISTICYDKKGSEVGRAKLLSAVGKTSIKLTPECTNMGANGQDLCFINIDLVGENGITKSSVDQKLKVEVQGAGTLQGYGSARPCMSENFYSDTHTTFYGKSLAVVRAGYEPGKIEVRVSGQGIEPQTIVINVE